MLYWLQPNDENPASLKISMASCLPSLGWPRRMSKLAVGIPCACMHFDIHPSPEKTSMKPYAWWSRVMQTTKTRVVEHESLEQPFRNTYFNILQIFWGCPWSILGENIDAGVAGHQQHASNQHLQERDSGFSQLLPIVFEGVKEMGVQYHVL